MMNKSERARKRAKIVAVYLANGDWRRTAADENIKRSTAYRWVEQGEQGIEDKRGGKCYSKVKDIHREHMVSMIESNCRITLGEIVASLAEKFDLHVCAQTVSNHLDSMVYTLKSVRFEPERANHPDNKIKRKQFVEKLLNYQGQNIPIVFMDETNLNIHISRSEGRSVKGSRCTTVAAGSKGANVHCIGAISNLGLIHYELKRGSFKKENALVWMRTCLRIAMEKHGGPIVLVIDNAPCHSNIEAELLKEDLADCKVLRLGRYSPMFNPIENIWSVMKSQVKCNLASELNAILSSTNREVTIKEQRIRVLERLMLSAVDLVTPALCNSSIASTQSKVIGAINLEDVGF